VKESREKDEGMKRTYGLEREFTPLGAE